MHTHSLCLCHITNFVLCVVLLKESESAQTHVTFLALNGVSHAMWKAYAENVGHWCHMASSKWDTIVNNAWDWPMGSYAACSSKSYSRARWTFQCDSFAPQDDNWMKLFRIIWSSKGKNGCFVHFQIWWLMDWLSSCLLCQYVPCAIVVGYMHIHQHLYVA
jgi:hypothetical protein